MLCVGEYVVEGRGVTDGGENLQRLQPRQRRQTQILVGLAAWLPGCVRPCLERCPRRSPARVSAGCGGVAKGEAGMTVVAMWQRTGPSRQAAARAKKSSAGGEA